MTDRITKEGRDGTFGAYIARPKILPAQFGFSWASMANATPNAFGA